MGASGVVDAQAAQARTTLKSEYVFRKVFAGARKSECIMLTLRAYGRNDVRRR